jgi:hypothetical protein
LRPELAVGLLVEIDGLERFLRNRNDALPNVSRAVRIEQDIALDLDPVDRNSADLTLPENARISILERLEVAACEAAVRLA